MEYVERKSLEPPMLLQRPSSTRSQDVSHVLASAFRDLITENVDEQTVKYLSISRTGGNSYHEEYVQRLTSIQYERQRQLDELAMLETHIMQSRAAATAAEEQELQQIAEQYSDYESLGLPPVKSHLRYCMDTDLLRRHRLITPDDYITTPKQATRPPQVSPVPSYARPTTSSMVRYSKDEVADNYYHEKENIESRTYPFSLGTTEEPPSPTSSKPRNTNKSRVSSSWRETIKPDQRVKDRQDLKKLTAKVDYLRNPRNEPPAYPTLIKSPQKKISTLNQREENVPSSTYGPFTSSDFLVPSPSPVVFSVYDVGEVYEIKLELKNVSSALRQIRVLPPATKYFSIGLGQYPGESGMIAPGMSCQFAIKFAPDSLTDYVDKIQIRTQLDDVLDIQLLGKRRPPELTICSVLDTGFCLVGGNKTVSFKCLNFGGPGRFCFIQKSQWPTTSCKWSLEEPGVLDLEAFSLRPAMFQLLEGQEITINLKFTPRNAKFYKHDVFLICDNCQVKEFSVKGVGQTARVEFVSVDGGTSEPAIGESRDSTSQYLVRFDDQNPCTKRVKKLLVKNMSDVVLPFFWKLTKPHMQCFNTLHIHEQGVIQSRDESSVFKIVPECGTLQPAESFEFFIESSPLEIGAFCGVANLVLQQVPVLKSDENVEELNEDTTVLKIELKVSSKPYQVSVFPSVMYIPGKLLVGKPYKFQIKIKNNSVFGTDFNWISTESNSVMNIEPECGHLDISQEKVLDVNVCGIASGIFESTIYCQVDHSSDPTYFHIRAEFQGPLVTVEAPDLNFGLVRFGESTSQTLVLRNRSELAAHWSLAENPYYHLLDVDQDFKEMPSEFSCQPPCGELAPFEKTTVEVFFTPLTCRRVRSVLECSVINSKPRFVSLSAEVQSPDICVLSSVLMLEEIYAGVPLLKQIEMENKTLLNTEYHWCECFGVDSESSIVQFDPCRGVLGPRERKTFSVLVTCSKQGPLSDLVAVCNVIGMEDSVYLSLEGTVRGLEVEFRAECAENNLEVNDQKKKDALSLDFGKALIGETPKTQLVLTNKSAIRTKFNIEPLYFKPGRVPTPPSGASLNKKTRSQGILAKTPNIADPLSKTPAKAHTDFCRSLLRDDRGVAFVCTPSCGELEPFQEQVVQVTAYSDMWGDYQDNIICKITGLEDKYIPLFLKVDGLPLSFQMTKDKSPIVRFGTHVSGSPPVQRILRVNNISPCDVRVDWVIYNELREDDQLIDLVVDVGDPFPKIETEKPEKETILKEGSAPAISVNVRKHIGTLSSSPFTVVSSQQVIPARSHSDITLKFEPFSNTSVDIVYSSFALGFINLDDPDEIQNEHVKRCVARAKEPIRLNMTGGIKPAILSVAYDDEEHTDFTCYASDLLKLGPETSVEVLEEIHRKKFYTLRNTTEATITFNMVVEEPFRIMQLEAPPSACPAKKKNTKITLKPRKNVQVGVGFCLSRNMLKREDCRPQSVQDAYENGVLPTLEVNKQLTIKFSNNTSQIVPLHAVVSLPHLLISKETLDFGDCLIGQTKELNIDIKNYGKSCSQWFVEKDPMCPEESREVFHCSPTNAFLEGHRSNISNNANLLKITFTPRCNVGYECVFIFKGLLHEPPRYLVITGRGSNDGGHEEVVGANAF